MTAEVYPFKRLPRRFDVFDYAIPEGLEVRRGSVVRVPFRASTMWGVVARVKEDSAERKLKALNEVHAGLTLTEAEVAWFEALSHDLAQSVSAILHVAIPSLPQRAIKPRTESTRRAGALTLPSNEADALRATVSFLLTERVAFASAPDLRRSAAIIQTYLRQRPGCSLVLAPNVRDAVLLARHLEGARIITGEESQAARRTTWLAWREHGGLLVGTRVAALLPRATLDTIFVVRSGHENHKQEDRNPRFDARAVARLRATQQEASLYFLDVLPRPDELDAETIDAFVKPEPVIVELSKEAFAGIHPTLSPTFMERAERTLESGGRVLCVYNYKGLSKGERKGLSNQDIVEALMKAFPGVSVGLLDAEHPNTDRGVKILVTTQFFLEQAFDPFNPPAFGLVANLAADFSLRQGDFRATERAVRTVLEWQGVAHACRAAFLLQTDAPEVYRNLFKDPLAFMREELAQRQAYDYPPARRHLRVWLRSADLPEEHLEALEKIVRAQAPSASLERREGQLNVSIAPDAAKGLLDAFRSLDDRYIIDTCVGN